MHQPPGLDLGHSCTMILTPVTGTVQYSTVQYSTVYGTIHLIN